MSIDQSSKLDTLEVEQPAVPSPTRAARASTPTSGSDDGEPEGLVSEAELQDMQQTLDSLGESSANPSDQRDKLAGMVS